MHTNKTFCAKHLQQKALFAVDAMNTATVYASSAFIFSLNTSAAAPKIRAALKQTISRGNPKESAVQFSWIAERTAFVQ